MSHDSTHKMTTDIPYEIICDAQKDGKIDFEDQEANDPFWHKNFQSLVPEI